jgi:hypothetical protein
MIRVVLDTNIIVSAYLNEDGQPFRILKLALAGARPQPAQPHGCRGFRGGFLVTLWLVEFRVETVPVDFPVPPAILT